MKTASRIRFNPVTKEIEIEGSEEFVKTYFDKIQRVISGDPSETVKEPKAVKFFLIDKSKKEPKAAKPDLPKKTAKRVTNVDTVVSLIKSSKEGISTAELKEKTRLSESQIWNIVNRATRLGQIRKVKRGLYGAA
jgi:hypothetical protein